MNRWAVVALFFMLGLQTACSPARPVAAPCHQDIVQTSPGFILPLGSGQTYEVYPSDNTVSMMWLPMDKLTVCPIGGTAVEMTNLSKKNQKIRAVQILNPGLYVWPY